MSKEFTADDVAKHNKEGDAVSCTMHIPTEQHYDVCGAEHLLSGGC